MIQSICLLSLFHPFLSSRLSLASKTTVKLSFDAISLPRELELFELVDDKLAVGKLAPQPVRLTASF